MFHLDKPGWTLCWNKKVFLSERKRHTYRGVACTLCRTGYPPHLARTGYPPWPGQDTPPGRPRYLLRQGTPWPGQGTPWTGYSPWPDQGTPPARPRYPPHQAKVSPWTGYPPGPSQGTPPPTGVVDKVKFLPSLVLRTWSVITSLFNV